MLISPRRSLHVHLFPPLASHNIPGLLSQSAQCYPTMFITLLLFASTIAYALASTSTTHDPNTDPLAYVNPLIGSTNGGNVFSGASLPYSIAKAVADVDGQNTAGFASDNSRVTGFSALHDSGTGGNPSLGNFPLFPQVCADSDDVNSCRFGKSARATGYRNESVVARPGYFGLELESGIVADMTVAARAALFRFSFPSSTSTEDGGSPLILLDLTDLWDSRQNASISVIAEDARILANGTFLPSFGAGSYRAYTCVDFYGGLVRDSGIWVNDRAGTDVQRSGSATLSRRHYGHEPLTWNGSIWDSFRVQHPLLTIIDPETQSRMVRSLLDTYKHEGYLPDCRMSLCKGWTQGGSNADIVLADAYVKNLTGPIDWSLAYEAMVNDAEKEPLEWSYEGRGGLQSWKRLGYIPYLDFDYLGFGTNSRSISRTVEYAYNDFCVATVGRGLGKGQEYETYLARSGNWRNLYKKDQTSFVNGTDTGFVGFFQPRYLNGSWGYQDPIACSALSGSWCSLTSNPSETFESSVWEYQFYVPHAMSSLIHTLGGDSAFTSRLDYFHTSGLADIGNEPVFLTVYQYHYAGRPALSAKRVHSYIPSRFNASFSGLPGNDDSGAMGAFTAFAMMGLFPNPGQNVYLITPPFFEEISVENPVTSRTATVRIRNFDPRYSSIYIQKAWLNGEVYGKSWIGHEFFTEGGTLELVLGEEESEWGRASEDRPPSWEGEYNGGTAFGSF
ncbi:hypothetical protein AN3764.2 [Aspergillus nidulans FGSC A4]|uniref:Uncharacterized protein n=1 Tax=Emericella nidulans (strain FGSC A4 / ATCC 38163 / CBS 112.46 / NRRL 194 / M139) TaxID=227321 RepID=Q5B6R6_EMENI|nr:hypothetical protein [Aspergillus nidulans FGSC A4]EAA59972.1 hypothetical protein AN3764.2 [Aspergillus nidulans FGSC A4]CBF75442.1 TPA: conserved hypothetical protein [Aspergillus nidulans FGSC A4]|eukprot:XP_661368.1 hypothetical protein AN3764.2 [Aspergillus nidulans FGSC A4]